MKDKDFKELEDFIELKVQIEEILKDLSTSNFPFYEPKKPEYAPVVNMLYKAQGLLLNDISNEDEYQNVIKKSVILTEKAIEVQGILDSRKSPHQKIEALENVKLTEEQKESLQALNKGGKDKFNLFEFIDDAIDKAIKFFDKTSQNKFRLFSVTTSEKVYEYAIEEAKEIAGKQIARDLNK